MTLLEAMTALVILALAGVGALELLGGSGRATADASSRLRALQRAESAMERTLAGERVVSDSVRILRSPSGDGLVVVTVTAPVADGGAVVLHRLERAR